MPSRLPCFLSTNTKHLFVILPLPPKSLHGLPLWIHFSFLLILLASFFCIIIILPPKSPLAIYTGLNLFCGRSRVRCIALRLALRRRRANLPAGSTNTYSVLNLGQPSQEHFSRCLFIFCDPRTQCMEFGLRLQSNEHFFTRDNGHQISRQEKKHENCALQLQYSWSMGFLLGLCGLHSRDRG